MGLGRLVGRGLAGAPVRLLLVCCWLSLAVGLPGEAPWGNAWSNAQGVMQATFQPLAVYYTCTVRTTTYPSLAACSIACEAGRCERRSEMVTPPAVAAVMMSGNASGATSYVSTFSPGIMMGQNLNFTVKGATAGMSIRVQDDPGLPLGMTSHTIPEGLLLDWTPREGQQGVVYELVLSATRGGVQAVPWRIRVPVIPPSVAFDQPMDMVGDAAVLAVPGEPAQVELRCLSNYPAWMMVAPGYEALPAGMTVSTGTDGAREFIRGALGPFPPSSRTVTFNPLRGSEGSETTICLDCNSLEATARRCVTFRVELCKYASKEGDTLLSVSREVFSQPNWRRLWNLNSHLEADPQTALGAGSIISIGPMYNVLPGDTLDQIAGRFHTTTKNILLLNPHMREAWPGTGSKQLDAGRMICLPTCTSSPNPTLDYIHPY